MEVCPKRARPLEADGFWEKQKMERIDLNGPASRPDCSGSQ